jgi:hypothetical protein
MTTQIKSETPHESQREQPGIRPNLIPSVVIPFAGSDRRREVLGFSSFARKKKERNEKESKRVLNSVLFLQSCLSQIQPVAYMPTEPDSLGHTHAPTLTILKL